MRAGFLIRDGWRAGDLPGSIHPSPAETQMRGETDVPPQATSVILRGTIGSCRIPANAPGQEYLVRNTQRSRP